jgi:UDP-glucuronate 4-epimerase
MKRCLITGVAGFIGFHLAKEMLEQGYEIVGVDDLNDYYDPKIKYSRLKILEKNKNFKFYIANIADQVTMGHIFNEHEFDAVCNLAAYAGVRYSLIKPFYYIQSNIVGFQVILEMVRDHEIENFVFASSASVYGSNEKQPFSEDDPVDNPMAIYAVTKRQNELAAKSYNHLFGLNCTGLRYFTAYGPYGRPDLALFKFTKNILEDKPIDIYNHGMMERTFTFIDDVIKGTIAAIERPMGYEIFNIGGEENIDLIQYVDMIEDCLGKKAIRNYMELQPGDITAARCDISKAKKLLDYQPRTSIDHGIEMFIDWYRDFYGV